MRERTVCERACSKDGIAIAIGLTLWLAIHCLLCNIKRQSFSTTSKLYYTEDNELYMYTAVNVHDCFGILTYLFNCFIFHLIFT